MLPALWNPSSERFAARGINLLSTVRSSSVDNDREFCWEDTELRRDMMKTDVCGLGFL